MATASDGAVLSGNFFGQELVAAAKWANREEAKPKTAGEVTWRPKSGFSSEGVPATLEGSRVGGSKVRS